MIPAFVPLWDRKGRLVVAYDTTDYRALVINEDTAKVEDAAPPLYRHSPPPAPSTPMEATR
ncbi:hypothetical protein [Gordonia humi]|uniref:Uncharacterized protein n=1 Tax=Gordonia humi TaxID=686429 RepID=A0A840EPJ4_9ACTN|nr:hypothetical protein [Gordonia humi]MBB4134735.1 hypothetical protein [Gordonia humi]